MIKISIKHISILIAAIIFRSVAFQIGEDKITLLYVKSNNPINWGPGTIFLNDDSIGFGTTPTLSYDKKRIAYLDTNNVIRIFSGETTDSIYTLPFKRAKLTLSWDTSGNLFTTQELRIVKIDTSTKTCDTVYTFRDSSFLTPGYVWHLSEGNVSNGSKACFTLNRGDNSYNRIFYIDIKKDTLIRAYTQNAACQAGISNDGNFVTGTYFGHTRCIVSKVSEIALGFKYIKPLPDFTVWQLRFNKFNDSLFTFVSLGSGQKNSTITNFYGDTIIARIDSIELWDCYIPPGYTTIAERVSEAKYRIPPINTIDAVYDINGRRVSAACFKRARTGVYIIKSGKKFKKITILR
ncbi:MAG: hypothetical protein JNL74_08130 [Fibrobacteres bacterium]|nr:hypothetical protein [Fibrobacterota bacterium]